MFFFIEFLGKGSDHSISGSSSLLDIVESVWDLVLTLVLVVLIVLVGAFLGLVSSLVTVETQSFFHVVCHLFSREFVNIHYIWVWGESGCWHILVDWGLCSVLSSYYFLYSAPLIIKSTGMGIPVLNHGGDSLERVDLLKEFQFQIFHEVFNECGLVGYFGSLG